MRRDDAPPRRPRRAARTARAPRNATTPLISLTAKGQKPAIRARFEREAARERELDAKVAEARQFAPNFDSPAPLEQKLGLTPREAEVLLWVAQGKSNGDIAIICGAAEKTIKRHLTHVFEKLGVEGRNAASLRALEILSASSLS